MISHLIAYLAEGLLVVGEGAAPSRHANLAFPGVYKTPLHGWCYPPRGGIVLWGPSSSSDVTAADNGWKGILSMWPSL